MLAGLRQGRTLGTPLALVVRNRDHKNWTWGMSPWPPEGEPEGKGTKEVTLPRPGHADLAGVQKYGLSDVRDALERASARHTAVHVAAGAVAKALLKEIGIEVRGSTDVDEAAIDAARKDQDTLGGIVEVRATGVPPGLGSYARKEDRLDARLAAALMGIQAVKGVEIGDGFALAELRGSEAHDEIGTDHRRMSNRAGGIEGGMSNGEEIVVRAGMKPLPTLMKPLALRRPADGRGGECARRAQRRLRRRGARRRRRGGSRMGAGARSAREVRRRRARRLRRRVEGVHGADPLKKIALVGFMGAGKTTAARVVGLPVVDSDELVEQVAGKPIAEIFRDDGEQAFRSHEEEAIVLALGGGAVTSAKVRERPGGHAHGLARRRCRHLLGARAWQ